MNLIVNVKLQNMFCGLRIFTWHVTFHLHEGDNNWLLISKKVVTGTWDLAGAEHMT